MKAWKKWRVALVAMLAAFAVVLSAAAAYAGQPGEGSTWSPETVNNGQELMTRNQISEARNGGHIVDVWRGATNNQVWISEDHGTPFTIGNTATNVAPTVVAWGFSYFMIFHVGTDNNIYYTWVNPVLGEEAPQGWVAIPDQTTRDSVSVTQAPGFDTNSELYMVYRSSNDDRIWGTAFTPGNLFFPATASWGNIVNIDGGLSPSAPSVTYNQTTGLLYAVTRGEDNEIYVNSANISALQWGIWASTGGSTPDTPTVAAAQNGTGNMLASYRGFDDHIYLSTFNSAGNDGVWQQDTTGWQTNNPIFLSANGSTIYLIATGLDDVSYWKVGYQT